MTSAQQGPIAKWLYGGGPQRLGITAAAAIRRHATRRRLVVAGIGATAIGVAALVVSRWPKPPEHGLPAESVRQCVIAITEIPTEFAARKAYQECLDEMAFRIRQEKWKAYGEQLRLRNERCGRAPGDCPPEPVKPQ